MADLVTVERKLEDDMLKFYPGKIFGSQYEKRWPLPGKKFYIFKNLEDAELEGFLNNYEDCGYIIVRDGKIETINNIQNFRFDWETILNTLTTRN